MSGTGGDPTPPVPLVLDLLRHGEAAAAGAGGDAERPLTERGRDTIRAQAQRLKREGWRPGRIFASPLPRALESAAIVLQTAGVALEVEPLPELLPDHEPSQLLDALAAHGAEHGHVVLVGHQPLLGRLASRLAGQEPELPTGGLIRIECPRGASAGAGRIVYVLKPER